MLIFRYAWIGFIAVMCINGGIWHHHARKNIEVNPDLEMGYRRLIRGWLIYGNLPWLVMGAGILFGGVPTVFHYFNPRNGPWVIAWYVTVVALWILTFIWLFFRRGAETLIEYPGLLRLPSERPWIIKAYFLVGVAGGVVALIAMALGNTQASVLLR